MPTSDGLPSTSQFLKWLLIVLFAEFMACTALQALSGWWSGYGLLSTALWFAASGTLLFCVASNVASFGMTFVAEEKEIAPYRPFVRFLTPAQTALLLTTCLCRDASFNAWAAVIAAVPFGTVAALMPGSIFPPLSDR